MPPSISSSQTRNNPPLHPTPEQTRQIAEARLALEASISNIGASLDSTLKTRATTLHANSAVLDKQQNALVKETKGLKKENDKLAKVALDMSGALKEVGNVQNWAEMLERDFSVVEETLRRVRGGGSEGSWSGSSWSGSESGEVEGDEENVGGGGGGDEMEGMEVTSPSSDFANVDTGNCIKGKGIDRSSMDQTIADGSPPINNTHDTITSTNSSAVPAT